MSQAPANFDLVVQTAIVRSEKPGKGLEAHAAPNPNQMHRLIGYLCDGRKVVVAQRHGKGGMDFNKLLGGKVYAVAADGFSPVYEKGADKKPTTVQKVEDGMPVYSASGFYMLSSKDYLGLDMFEAYTRLLNKGELVALVQPAALEAPQAFEVGSELDLDLLETYIVDQLSDDHNLVARFDEDINKKRARGISRAKEDTEEAGDAYTGVAFENLAVSRKDGLPCMLYAFRAGDQEFKGLILRSTEGVDEDSGQVRMQYLAPFEALAAFKRTPAYKALVACADANEAVQFMSVQGHVMRTSVSFRRKVENIRAAQKAAPTKPVYGDGVYVLGALTGWTRAITTLMHSMHPNFPAADYDAHHYVAAVRQAEIAMNKKADGSGWMPPQAMHYDLADVLLAMAPVAA